MQAGERYQRMEPLAILEFYSIAIVFLKSRRLKEVSDAIEKETGIKTC